MVGELGATQFLIEATSGATVVKMEKLCPVEKGDSQCIKRRNCRMQVVLAT